MADEIKNVYKYIDTDMDRDLLVKNLNHNVQGYVQHQGWDASKTKEFYDALDTYMKALDEGRLSTERSGALRDSSGILNNGTANWRDKNGNVVSQADYDNLRKRKKKGMTNNFYANREVATYFNNVAQALYNKKYNPAEKDKDKDKTNKFNLAKNNVWSSFRRYLAPNGTIDMDAWLNLDPYDETTKKRGTEKRAERFRTYINEKYLPGLAEDLDFSDSESWKDLADYKAAIGSLYNELGLNGVDDADFNLLVGLGGNPEEYRSMFTTDKVYTKPGTETPAKPGELSEEDKEALNTVAQQHQDYYTQHPNRYKTFTGKQKLIPIRSDAKTPEEKRESYIKNLNDQGINLPFTAASFQNTGAMEYGPYLQQYDEYNSDAFVDIDNGPYTGWRYIPGSLNTNHYTVLAYNPSNGQARRLFYGDIDRTGFQNSLLSNYQQEQLAKKPYFEEGGQPDASRALYKNSVNAINQFSKDRESSSAETKANQKLRQPWKEGTDYNENKFTNTDIARLGSVAADIAALIDPEPFSALGLGVASDVANLTADLKEGYGIWNSLGNFGANIGLSAVGMIPIFGDALGSGGKVVKTLMKMAPKVNKVLLASGALAAATNSDELIKSWKKIGKSGVENEMTVEDWRNIGTVIQLALGGANAVKNAKTVSKLRAKGKTDMLDVVCRDKATGKKKVFRFGDKEDIEALKNAKTTEDVNKVINSHNSLKGKYEVATQEGKNVTYFGENSKWYKPWTWKSTTKTTNLHPDAIQEAIDYNKIRATAKKGTLSRSEYIARNGTPGYNPGRTPEIITRANRTTTTNANRTGQKALPSSKEKLGLPSPGTVTDYKEGEPYEIVIRHRNGNIERIQGHEYYGTTPRQPITPNTVAAQANIPAGQAAIGYNQSSNLPPINRILTPQQEMQFRLNAATPAAPERSLLGRGTANAPHQRIGDLVRGARAYRQTQGSVFNPNTTPHSLFGNRLMQNGATESYLLSIGAWMRGGKLIRKGQAGLYTTNFIPEVPDYKFEVPPMTLNTNQNWFVQPKLNTTRRTTKNYGTGYESSINDYGNNEYGTADKVNISAILAADSGTRSSNLTDPHGNIDYEDAQAATTAARQKWQSNASNRITDFTNYVRNYLQEHPEATQGEILSAYNTDIDNMYKYKQQMGTADWTGANSYRKDTDTDKSVSNFNQTHRRVYGTANSKDYLGYDTGSEGINGTTTAQRYIDITSGDINNLDFSSAFTSEDTDDFKNLFKGLVKDATGRYYVQEDAGAYPVQPKTKLDASALQPNLPYSNQQNSLTNSNGNQDDLTYPRDENNEEGNSSKAKKFGAGFTDMLPEALSVGRYLAARNLNKKLLNIAKDMPVMLYQPMEAQRWVRGDQNAIQQGYQAAGQLGHLASQPLTANGAEQTAAMLEGLNKGQAYINQGYVQNDQVVNTSTEANWNQARANQQSRYNVATKNKENLFSKRANYLEALGNYHRANYESLNGLLGQYESDLRTKRDKLSTYRDALQEASLKNTIMGNLSDYGISQSKDDQDLVNQLMSGVLQVSDLTDEQKTQWARLSNSINEELTKRLAASKGINYTPFTPSTPITTPYSYSILESKHGGVLPADSEKITIQKLKGSVQKMLARQKHFEARLNAFEKDMDRSYKSASEYIKGQKKSK